jgi:hypothetical protein
MALVSGDPEHSFFDQNPTLKYISEFQKLKSTHSDKEVSKICWAVFMIEEIDSEVNKLARMPKEDRIKEVHETYYKLDIDKYGYLLDAYSKLVHTLEEQMFKIQMDKMDEITSVFKKLKLDKKDEFEKYLKIADKLPRIWDGLEKVKKRMIESNSKSKIRGGGKLSARERRK